MGNATLGGGGAELAWSKVLSPENCLNTTAGGKLKVVSLNGSIHDLAGNPLSAGAFGVPVLGHEWTTSRIDTVIPEVTGAQGTGTSPYCFGPRRPGMIRLSASESVTLPAGQTVRPAYTQPGDSPGKAGPFTGGTFDCPFTPGENAADGSINLTGLTYAVAGPLKLTDVVGNPARVRNGSVSVASFQVDCTPPTNLALIYPSGDPEPLSGSPLNPTDSFVASATDGCALGSVDVVITGLPPAPQVAFPTWNRAPSQAHEIMVRARDAAQNVAERTYSVGVDNPRVTAYRAFGFTDPIPTDTPTKVFPAGYPCTVTGEMQNGGELAIPQAIARFSLMSGESEIAAVETDPEDLPAESWSGSRSLPMMIPVTTSPGSGYSLQMRHATPAWTIHDMTPATDPGYAVASAKLEMTAVLADDEIVAGDTLSFCIQLAQDDNGGVATHADVLAEGFDGVGGQHWTDGSLGITFPTTILSRSGTPCLPLPSSRPFVVDKRTSNDTTFVLDSASFRGKTDQWGASPEAHGSRFVVQYQLDSNTPTASQTIKVTNAVLASSASETEEFAPWTAPLHGYWGQDLTFYIGIRNDRDVADPRYRLEMGCPNDGWFDVLRNVGWELKSPPSGDTQTWVFDPAGAYPVSPLPSVLPGATETYVPVVVRGRPDGYNTPDGITVRVYSDRRWTALTRDKQIVWDRGDWNKRSMCYPGSSVVDAGSVLPYQLVLNAAQAGSPNRAVQVLVSKEALDVMDLALNSPSQLALDKGTGTDVAFTQEMQCVGTTTYFATDPQAITASQTVTWTLKAKTRSDLADQLDTVGLLRSAVLLRLDDGSCVGVDASECPGNNTLVTVRNVRLEFTIEAGSVGSPVVIPAGGSGAVRITLANRGGRALGAGGEATAGNAFVAGVGESSHPAFNLAGGLGSGQSLPTIDWTITAAKTAVAYEGGMVPGLFQSLDGWCLKYPPVRPECGFTPTADLVQTGGGIRITSPNLQARILQTPTNPQTIPTGDYLTLTVQVENVGDQAGQARISVDPIAGLRWTGGGWPSDSTVTAPAGAIVQRVMNFEVTAGVGTVVVLEGKVHPESEFQIATVQNQLADLMVVGPALDISEPSSPSDTIEVRKPLVLRYTVDNNQASGSLVPSLTILAPVLSGGAPSGSVRLVDVCFRPDRTTEVGKVCRTDYTFGTKWTGLPAIGWDKTGMVEIQLVPGLSIPDGTQLTPGNVKIEWDGGDDDASTEKQITINNSVVGTETVTPSPLEPLAGGLVDYRFTITNTSGVPRPANPPLALLVSRPAGLSWASGNTALRDTLPFADSTATDVTVQFRIARDWSDLTMIDRNQFGAGVEFMGDGPEPPIIDDRYEVGDYTSVAPRNVRFRITDPDVAFDSPEFDYLAGDTLRLGYALENIGQVVADTVSVIVRYEHQVSGGSATIDSLELKVAGGLPVRVPKVLQMSLPLSVSRFRNGDTIKFRNVRIDAAGRGRDAPLEGQEGITNLPPGGIQGLKLVCDIRRLSRFNGAALDEVAARLGVNQGAVVPFGLLLRNEGAVKHSGSLEIRLPLPLNLLVAGDSTHPRDDWFVETQGTQTWVRFTREITPATWPQGSAQEIYLVPAGTGAVAPGIGLDTRGFSGDLRLALGEGTIVGQYTISGTRTVEPEFRFTTGSEPWTFSVNDCDATSLRTTLHVVGTQAAFQRGDQIPLRMEMLFEGDPGLVLRGDLVLTATLKDDRFEFVGAALGEPVREWASVTPATEKTVVMRSTDIRGGSDNKVSWELTIQTTKLEQPGTVEVDLTSAIELNWSWTVRPGSSNDCGFNADQGGVGWDNGELWIEATHRGGEMVKLLGRPNPASQETRICYDLEIGTTRVELFVTDLAGNLILHTVSSASRALRTSAGFNEFVWDVREVPNGVYLARLEVDGTGTNGRSLRETRRVKLAVLK